MEDSATSEQLCYFEMVQLSSTTPIYFISYSIAVAKVFDTTEFVSTKDKALISTDKELLCFFFTYHSTTLNENYLEAQKDLFEVSLSDKDLQMFATWIYTGERPLPIVHYDVVLYIFADQADILALRRTFISGFMSTIPRYNLAKIIPRNLPQS